MYLRYKNWTQNRDAESMNWDLFDTLPLIVRQTFDIHASFFAFAIIALALFLYMYYTEKLELRWIQNYERSSLSVSASES